MRIDIECNNPFCGTVIGYMDTFEFNAYGCDPPETTFFDADCVDSDGYGYCSQECLETVTIHEDEETCEADENTETH